MVITSPKRRPLAGAGRQDRVEMRQVEAQKEAVQLKQKEIREGLPHLYGRKWYRWAKAFFESENEVSLLCAANQISKSSTQWRKMIDLATNVKRQKKIWPTSTPRMFWYLYPTKSVATIEFEKKVEPEFLPRGAFKDHPVYGWRAEYKNKDIHAIHFNSGVSIYFKTYAQDVQDLQTGTVHVIGCDEELPEELYDELMLRLSAVDGLFGMVFTATLNQNFWRQAIEGKGQDEKLVDAFKIQVSMYDCILYEDGSPGAYTEEKINRIKAKCKSETEILRRVYGRFVTEKGRKYGAFDPSKHVIKNWQLPPDYKVYTSVDGGKGGTAHPSAVLFLAVSPDHRKGVAFRMWRGDNVVTTAGDVYEKYVDMRGGVRPVLQCFDHAYVDFGTIVARAGESFIKANKSHAIGEDVVNTLFKNDMLFIVEGDGEFEQGGKLAAELVSLMRETPKTKAKDDLCDTLRYSTVLVPWDWTALAHAPSDMEVERRQKAEAGRPLTPAEQVAREIDERRGIYAKRPETEDAGWAEHYAEIDHWNEAAGT